MVAAPHPALAWLAERRRRLAPVILVGGLALVAGPLADAAPRATRLRLELEEPQEVRAVALSVLDAGEAVLGLRLAYELGAPDRIFEELELPPGRYELRVDVTRAEGAERSSASVVRPLEVPTDGTVRLALGREAR